MLLSIVVPCYNEESTLDRKSTRLNSSHANISYAVFCLKKKKTVVTEETVMQAIHTTRHGVNVGFDGVTHGVALPEIDLSSSLTRVRHRPRPERRPIPAL